MAIFDIEGAPKKAPEPPAQIDRLYSRVCARLFFVLLLIADVFWGLYSFALLIPTACLNLLTLNKVDFIQHAALRAWISVKRALVCGLSLLIALFSPAFGIMVACTYFLMYDKAGLEEIVPSSIQSQFKDLFRASS